VNTASTAALLLAGVVAAAAARLLAFGGLSFLGVAGVASIALATAFCGC